MLKLVYKTFLKGLITLLPVALTVYLLVWLCASLERFFGSIARWVLPEGWYLPGLGLIMGIALIFVVGLLFEAWIVRQLWRWFEFLLNRLPVIKSLYGPIKDIIKYMGGDAAEQAQQVVMVELGNSVRLLGMVTREDFDKVADGIGGEDQVAVYCPMSYQVGGYTLFVSQSSVHPVDMKMQDALRFALTAGVITEQDAVPADSDQTA